ncbi:MAG: hypothetical protein Q9211_004522 [Gyalolechia sp. 1 TL-2023]
MADVISAVGKLATTRNIAVLLSNQTTTKVMLESAAALQPAISGAAWDAGINCRLLLFQDWQEETDESGEENREFNSNVSSRILSLQEPTGPLPATSGLKRKRDEVADSASESGSLVADDEFGWVED